MKFTISNADLLGLITAATAVSKSPDPIQIIAERLGDTPGETPFDTEERPAETGRIRVIAFNETMTAEWRRPAEIRMTGKIALQADGLDRLIKASRGSDSTFTLETVETDNEDSLRVATSRSAHEFPSVSDRVFDTVIPGHASGKRADLSNLATAMGTAKIAVAARGDAAGGRVMLTGVHLRNREGLIDVVGTDAKRLALTTLKNRDLGSFDISDIPGGITVPPEALGLITDMLSGQQACFEVVGNSVIVENSEGSLSVRLIEIPYPDYTNLLKMGADKTVALPRASLETALQRSSVALTRDKRMVAVKLTRGEEGVYLTSEAAGQSSSECVSDEPGDDFAIGFDARYMLNAMTPYGHGEITLQFANEVVPIRISSATHPEIQMLVMPCRV